jgi:hypothetical protein
MGTYPEEDMLEEAVNKAMGDCDGVVIGWAVVIAYRNPEHLDNDDTAHAHFTPSGQPRYATVGLLQTACDWIRGIAPDDCEAAE